LVCQRRLDKRGLTEDWLERSVAWQMRGLTGNRFYRGAIGQRSGLIDKRFDRWVADMWGRQRTSLWGLFWYMSILLEKSFDIAEVWQRRGLTEMRFDRGEVWQRGSLMEQWVWQRTVWQWSDLDCHCWSKCWPLQFNFISLYFSFQRW
jgi:hypothetical protein